MKTQIQKNHGRQAAYALLTVTVMAGVSIALYASIARLTASSALVNDRNNTYNSAVAAAEAASEKALSFMARDFQNQSFNPNNLNGYQALIPDNDWAAAYEFSDNAGSINRTWVGSSTNIVMENLNSQFEGLYGLVYNCTVRSKAKPQGTPYEIAAAVEQDVQLASIPVFQFAIFYAMDLEVNPGANMKITGKVHSNANIWTAPPARLEYCDDVTSVGFITNSRAPGDPNATNRTIPFFDKEHLGNTSSLTLPIATNNSPAAVAAILQVPPSNEDVHSQQGQQRYYNNVDLIITTTPTNVVLQAGTWDHQITLAGDTTNGTRYSFISTNTSFWDARENKNTLITQIDVGAFTNWLNTSSVGSSINYAAQASTNLGHQLSSIYVNDTRQVAGKLTAVRVKNGKYLPPSGLTVATALPIYVQGDFNAPNPGSSNTANTKPASLVGDAITVLSGNWSDANSANGLSTRNPTDTTVNAAFLAGIVQTTTNASGGHYSGGVENFPRFLENWGGTFTYNGSMVVLFPSKYATNFWVQTGTYYNAPTRNWAFDVNFLDYHKLPPATPQVRKLVRGQWSVVAVR